MSDVPPPGVAEPAAVAAEPVAPSAVRPSRRGLPAMIALLGIAALAAGILTRMILGFPTRQPGRATAQLPEEVVVDGLAARAEAAALEHVVLQLDVSADCLWPDCTVPWGHVPAFTLLDDGRVFYLDPDPVDRHPPRWIVRAAAPSPDAMALLTDQVDQFVRGHAAQTADGDPCPAANGCPGSVIVRVRRDGVLRTYAADEGTAADARSALGGAAKLLDGWSAEADAPLPRTMVVVPAGATEQRSSDYGDEPPRFWLGGGSALDDLPAFMERDALDIFALSKHGPPGASDAQAGTMDAVVGGAPASGPAFAGVDDATLYRPKGWEFKTGEIPMPTVDGSDASLLLVTRLVFVPWIYPDVDVAAMLDVYREARRNAAAARAAADATAIAAGTPLPYDVAVTSVAQPLRIVVPPSPTPFPTALAVTWSDDGRPQLPSARGIQTWMHWFRGDADRVAIGRLRQAGFGWFKQRFAWKDIEPDGPMGWPNRTVDMFVDPYVEAVRQHGGQVMIQLGVPPQWALDDPTEGAPFNLSAWRAFVGRFATRFNGRVAVYEIMNEPNLAREWGGPPDPAVYARVLKAAYEAIKAEDPSAVVISAGLAPTINSNVDNQFVAMNDVLFLRGLLAAVGGATSGDSGNGYFDAIGVHAPGFKAAPDVSPDDAATREDLGGDRTFTFRRIEDLWREANREGARPAPFVITEFGWTTDPRPDSTYNWMAVDPATRGSHIARAFAVAPTLPGIGEHIGPMILFSAADRAWTPDDEAYWWAVADGDGNVDGAVMEALGSGGGDAER